MNDDARRLRAKQAAQDLKAEQARALESVRRVASAIRDDGCDAGGVGQMGDVDREAVDAALERVAAGKCCSADADLLRRYICGLEAGRVRCVYCGKLGSGRTEAVRQHVEHDCQEHYARQLEKRIEMYEDSTR